MDDERIYEHEERTDRRAVATTLHELADGIDRGTVSFDSTTISVADRPSLEIEVDREGGDDEGATVEIEVEIEWTEPEDTPHSERDAGSDEATVPRPEPEEETADAPESGPDSLARFELYRDRADEWRWRLVHRNGNIIADSGEGYTTRQSAKKGLRSVMANAPEAEIVETDDGSS